MRLRRLALAAGALAAVVLIAVQLAACGLSPTASGTATNQATLPADVPAGFPVMDGATVVASPDPDVIAAWRIPDLGSGAYDFYSSALPRAGFQILGRYPADRSALIRFETQEGMVLQVVAEISDGGTLISLRADQP
jgi:hypothetical protein